jgi:hypothetical protein
VDIALLTTHVTRGGSLNPDSVYEQHDLAAQVAVFAVGVRRGGIGGRVLEL